MLNFHSNKRTANREVFKNRGSGIRLLVFAS